MNKLGKKFKKKNIPAIRMINDFVKCVKCGHTLPLIDREKGFCQYCGRYIFRTKKFEFNYRMKEKLK